MRTGVGETFRYPSSDGWLNSDTSMNEATSKTAISSIRWVGSKEFRPPWLRYNPTLCVDNIAELNMTTTFWDIVVRAINSADVESRVYNVTFQFASPRAPHDLLAVGMDFGLFEGPGVCVWRGTVEETIVASRNPSSWYGNESDT